MRLIENNNNSIVQYKGKQKNTSNPHSHSGLEVFWYMYLARIVGKLRGQDLNLRPSGYEPDELPCCSTPR